MQDDMILFIKIVCVYSNIFEIYIVIMLLCPSECIYQEEGDSYNQYQVHTSLYHLTVSIPSNVMNRLFEDGNNLTITKRPSPDQEQSTPFSKSGIKT